MAKKAESIFATTPNTPENLPEKEAKAGNSSVGDALKKAAEKQGVKIVVAEPTPEHQSQHKSKPVEVVTEPVFTPEEKAIQENYAEQQLREELYGLMTQEEIDKKILAVKGFRRFGYSKSLLEKATGENEKAKQELARIMSENVRKEAEKAAAGREKSKKEGPGERKESEKGGKKESGPKLADKIPEKKAPGKKTEEDKRAEMYKNVVREAGRRSGKEKLDEEKLEISARIFAERKEGGNKKEGGPKLADKIPGKKTPETRRTSAPGSPEPARTPASEPQRAGMMSRKEREALIESARELSKTAHENTKISLVESLFGGSFFKRWGTSLEARGAISQRIREVAGSDNIDHRRAYADAMAEGKRVFSARLIEQEGRLGIINGHIAEVTARLKQAEVRLGEARSNYEALTGLGFWAKTLGRMKEMVVAEGSVYRDCRKAISDFDTEVIVLKSILKRLNVREKLRSEMVKPYRTQSGRYDKMIELLGGRPGPTAETAAPAAAETVDEQAEEAEANGAEEGETKKGDKAGDEKAEKKEGVDKISPEKFVEQWNKYCKNQKKDGRAPIDFGIFKKWLKGEKIDAKRELSLRETVELLKNFLDHETKKEKSLLSPEKSKQIARELDGFEKSLKSPNK